jgi:uncharacterized protein YyaL (SSP411 family)
VLGTRRKPFQDSPTPAGNSMAAITLTRLYAYTGDSRYQDQARKALELLTGAAGQFGIFAATFGLAASIFSVSHSEIVVVGEDELAEELYARATASSQADKSVLKLTFNQATETNLPPSLAATIPQLPAIKQNKTCVIVCSEGSCKPPAHTMEQLEAILSEEKAAA